MHGAYHEPIRYCGQNDGGSNLTKTISIFSKDFISTTTSIESASTGWNFSTSKLIVDLSLYQFNFNQHITQPPEA